MLLVINFLFFFFFFFSFFLFFFFLGKQYEFYTYRANAQFVAITSYLIVQYNYA